MNYYRTIIISSIVVLSISISYGQSGWSTAGPTVYTDRDVEIRQNRNLRILGGGISSEGYRLRLMTNNAERLSISPNGNVGIGVFDPLQTLHVRSTANTYINLEKSSDLNESGLVFTKAGGAQFYFFTDNTDNGLKIIASGLEADELPRMQFPISSKNIYMAESGGNVGIGMSTPNYKLDVNGIVNATGLYVNSQPFSGSPWLTADSSIYYNNSVGIGKTPSYPLDVNGIVNATGLYINGQPFSGSQWLNAGSNIYFNNAVGIGTDLTTNPGNYSLAVNGKVNATELYSNGQLIVSSPWANLGNNIAYNTGAVSIGTVLDSNPNNYKLSVGGKINATELYANDELMISSQWATSGTNVLYNTGAVGIGTTLNSNPNNYKLSVGGKINATELYTNDKLVVSSQWITSNENIYYNGPVGIGTPLASNPNNYSLAVNGKVGAKEFRVEKTSATWPDYVFEHTYQLPSLAEVERFIKENKHLKDVPSQKEVERDGHSLGDMNAVLLKKIEELTLYVIELEKKNNQLEKRSTELERINVIHREENKTLGERLQALENLIKGTVKK